MNIGQKYAAQGAMALPENQEIWIYFLIWFD